MASGNGKIPGGVKENKTRRLVEKKQDDTSYIVEILVNEYNQKHQLQINDSYFAKEDDTLQYARRGVNIDIIDVPHVVLAMKELYEKATGKKLEF